MKSITDKEYFAIAEISRYGQPSDLYMSGMTNEFHSAEAAMAVGQTQTCDKELIVVKRREFTTMEVIAKIDRLRGEQVPAPPPTVNEPARLAPVVEAPRTLDGHANPDLEF